MSSRRKKASARRNSRTSRTPAAASAPARAARPSRAATPLLRPPRFKRFLSILGPGLVTGASDDDPAGIATYAVAGAAYGFATLWTAFLTFPMMAAVQFICAKIGLVTQQGIAGVIRCHYSRALLYPVVLALFLANTLNVAADLAGVAAGINLLVPLPVALLIVPIGVAILIVQVWGSYRLLSQTFKWLTLSLFSYIAAALLARPDWPAVVKATFMPSIHLDADYLALLVALLGTTISPYLFFWQASHEVEEKTACGPKRLWRRVNANELRYAFWDVNVGMLLSNVVMFFIILATATTLHRAGKTEIGTAAEAAEALRPLAGDAAYLLMALGLIGAGVLAVPVLTGSAAYAAAEACGWKSGLDRKPGQAREFYLVMAASMVLAIAINLLGINPVKSMLWSSIVNGLLAPPLLVVIMLIAGNRTIMGSRVNSPALKAVGWITTALMFAAAGALLVSWLR